MFLSKFFKHTRAKVLVALAGLTMVFGTAATISTVAATQQNEVVETKAASSSAAIHGQLGSEGSWSDHAMTSLGGELYVLYNVAMKSGNEFGMKVSGEWWGQATYVDAPSGFGTSGSNMKYTGSDKTYDFIYVANPGGGASANKLLIVEAAGSRTFTINCASVSYFTTSYIHFWSSGHSDFGTIWPGKSVTLSSNKFTITVPTCMNGFLLHNNGGKQTANLTFSSLSGDTGSVTCSSNKSGSVTWSSSGKTYILGSHNSWAVSGATAGASSGTSGVIQWTGVSFASSQQFKIAVCSGGSATYYGDDYFYEASDAAGCFSYTHGSGDNNIGVSTACTCDVFFNTSSHYIYIYKSTNPKADGYYMCGTGTFAGSAGDYSIPGTTAMDTEDVGTNVAILESDTGLSVAKNSSLQIAQMDFPQTMWYDMVKGGDWPTGWAVVSNQAKYTGEGGHFNFYVATTTGSFSGGVTQSNGTATLYIVDVDAIDEYGYFYIASSSAATSIGVTTKTSDGTVVVNNQKLNLYTGVVSTSVTVSFDSCTHIYRVPIFNLRGPDASKVVAQVVYNDGTEKTVTGIPNSQTTPHVYIKSGAATTGKGAAAQAVFELEAAMKNKSICDMSSSWSSLKALIEAGRSGDSALMDGAKITTCPSEGSHTTFNTLWNVSDIYKEICRQLGVASGIAAWPLSSFVIPGAPKGNESPLTLTLWIVLGCGVAGLGAIGTAYFVSKKKRHQA